MYGNNGTTNDPVSTATGEYFFGSIDLYLGGPLPLYFERYYASLLKDDGNVTSALGNNWMHNFDLKLVTSGTEAEVVYDRGRVIKFQKSGNTWGLKDPIPIIYQLIQSGTDYKLLDPSKFLIYTFNNGGKLTKIEDRNGNAHTLTYTGNNLSQVSDGSGRTLTFTYTGDKLTRVQDPNGRFFSFSYTGDNLTGYTNVLGHATTYSYTTGGSLVGLMNSETLPRLNIPYTQTFDSSGRVATQKDSGLNTTTVSYDTPSTGITTVIDPLGRLYKHTHQNQKQLTKLTDPDGNEVSLSYDSNNRRSGLTDRLGDNSSVTYHGPSGKIATYTDALGYTTTYTYTAQAQGGFTFYNLTKVDYPDGTSTNMTYDASGNMLTLTDQGGKTWTYTYNSKGQVLTATNPLTGVTTSTYNADGTLATLKDHFNNTANLTYDAMKRLTRVTYPDATFVAYTYDNNNNLLTRTDERGEVTTYTYDTNNNLSTVTDPLGNILRLTYDGNDRFASVIDPLNKTAAYTYDELGRLRTLTNPANEITTLGYSSRNWLTSITDPAGKTATRTYDKEGVPSSLTDPLSNTWNYASNKLGWTTQMTTPLSYTHNYVYDTMGRLTSYTDPFSKTISYSYDSRGLLSGVTLPLGISASYTRDNLGQITQITDPNGNAWNRTYDAMGRLTSETDPLSNVTSYAYDNRNRLFTATLPQSSLQLSYDATGNITRRLYSDTTDLNYTYDDNGRLLTANGLSLSYDARGDIISSNGLPITRDDAGRISSITLAAGKSVSYSYNNRGLVSQVSDWVGGTTNLTYDDVGRLSSLVRPNGVTANYTYDKDGRLIGITEQGSGMLSSVALTRNGLGNITTATRNVPLLLEFTMSTQTFSYNGANQVSGFTYDKMGRLTQDDTHAYAWDLASRLTSYTAGGNTTNFTYDGLGMRISRTSGGTTQQYIWNYAFALPSISVVRQGGSDLRYYIHLPGGRLLHSIGAADNTRHFYHFDEMGTTLFLTNDSGAITDSYGVTPYGMVTASTGTTDNPFTFIGAYGVMEEGDTGLYYMRARYYDSLNGRFISPDPVKSIHPEQINSYQYAQENPVRYADPSGLDGIRYYPNDIDTLTLSRLAAGNWGGDPLDPYQESPVQYRHDELLGNPYLIWPGGSISPFTMPQENSNRQSVRYKPGIIVGPSVVFTPMISPFDDGRLDFYLFGEPGSLSPLMTPEVTDPCEYRITMGNPKLRKVFLEPPDFGAPFKSTILGFAVIIIGEHPLIPFVVNSHTGTFDLSVFSFEPTVLQGAIE